MDPQNFVCRGAKVDLWVLVFANYVKKDSATSRQTELQRHRWILHTHVTPSFVVFCRCKPRLATAEHHRAACHRVGVDASTRTQTHTTGQTFQLHSLQRTSFRVGKMKFSTNWISLINDLSAFRASLGRMIFIHTFWCCSSSIVKVTPWVVYLDNSGKDDLFYQEYS